MPEYVFQGTVELNGVDFFVTAASEAEAKEKAKAGDWDHYEIDGAECVNADLRLSTCTLNE